MYKYFFFGSRHGWQVVVTFIKCSESPTGIEKQLAEAPLCFSAVARANKDASSSRSVKLSCCCCCCSAFKAGCQSNWSSTKPLFTLNFLCSSIHLVPFLPFFALPFFWVSLSSFFSLFSRRSLLSNNECKDSGIWIWHLSQKDQILFNWHLCVCSPELPNPLVINTKTP